MHHTNSVLRRERFIFDDVFVGKDAMIRLSVFIRQKTRLCLESARNMVIISVGCGDVSSLSSSSLVSSPLPPTSCVEPPVSLLIGGEGGSGLISTALDEIFRYIKPLTTQLRSNPSKHHLDNHTNGGPNMNTSRSRPHSSSPYPSSSSSSSSSTTFHGLRQTYEQFTAKVLLSVVVISNGEIYDLLASSTTSSSSTTTTNIDKQLAVQNSSNNISNNKISVRRRKSDGSYILCNASMIQLQSTADFDRIIGLLIGRRSAMISSMNHTLQLYKNNTSLSSTISSSSTAISALEMIESTNPWVLNPLPLNRNNTNPSSSSAATSTTTNTTDTMFITISASGGGVSKNKPTVSFHFTCPCGNNWSMPGKRVVMWWWSCL